MVVTDSVVYNPALDPAAEEDLPIADDVDVRIDLLEGKCERMRSEIADLRRVIRLICLSGSFLANAGRVLDEKDVGDPSPGLRRGERMVTPQVTSMRGRRSPG